MRSVANEAAVALLLDDALKPKLLKLPDLDLGADPAANGEDELRGGESKLPFLVSFDSVDELDWLDIPEALRGSCPPKIAPRSGATISSKSSHPPSFENPPLLLLFRN